MIIISHPPRRKSWNGFASCASIRSIRWTPRNRKYCLSGYFFWSFDKTPFDSINAISSTDIWCNFLSLNREILASHLPPAIVGTCMRDRKKIPSEYLDDIITDMMYKDKLIKI